MSRLVLVDRVADAPPEGAGTTVVVLDAAWTPLPGERGDILPIRPLVQSVVDEVDVIEGSLAALDTWATHAGLPDAFSLDGVAWWYRARMLLRWDVHELVLWRLVLHRLAATQRNGSIAVPAGRTGLIAAARATVGRGGATVEVRGEEEAAVRLARAARRRVGRLVRPLRSEPARLTARKAVLEQRFAALAARPDGLLVLAWPRAFQVVRNGDGERHVDPYLAGALDRLGSEVDRVTTIGLGLDHRRDQDWALIEASDALLPERFLVDRAAEDQGAPLESDAVRQAAARAGSVPHVLDGVDLGPAFAALVERYTGRWLARQRSAHRAANAALAALRPAAMFTDREGSRTAWLTAGRSAGIPSVAIQHGMIYPGNPEYFGGAGAGRLRPTVTCVFGDYERDLLVHKAGYRPDEVVVTGSPRPLGTPADPAVDAEADRAAVRRELGVRDGDRLLLVSVAHNEVLGELHTFGLLERTLGGPLPNIHVVIKLHPQDRAEPRHEALLRGLAAARGHDAPRLSIVRDTDLYRLLGAADAHLGQYSTVLSDAVVTGTPNMIAVGQAHADALGYVAAGVATPVRSVDEVRAFVVAPRPPDPEARRRFLDSHYRAGDAAGRLAGVLRRALGRRRTVLVVQARTGSTRLAGKVLLPLLGEPVLTMVMRRAARAATVDDVVVATTTLEADDAIVDLAAGEGWPVVRGSEGDLLERFLQAAREHRADRVVRITSDCPLIDPALIDDVVTALDREGADYASNTLEPRTFPRGLDVEVVTTAALETAEREDLDPASREHATPYVRTHPERFRQVRVAGDADRSEHRWTVDTAEDLELVRRIVEAIGHDRFTWLDALAVVEANPEWADLNRHVRQKTAPGA